MRFSFLHCLFFFTISFIKFRSNLRFPFNEDSPKQPCPSFCVEKYFCNIGDSQIQSRSQLRWHLLLVAGDVSASSTVDSFNERLFHETTSKEGKVGDSFLPQKLASEPFKNKLIEREDLMMHPLLVFLSHERDSRKWKQNLEPACGSVGFYSLSHSLFLSPFNSILVFLLSMKWKKEENVFCNTHCSWSNVQLNVKIEEWGREEKRDRTRWATRFFGWSINSLFQTLRKQGRSIV